MIWTGGRGVGETMTVYRTTIGCVPESDLSANRSMRVHPMRRHRLTKALREFTYWQAREDAPPEPLTGPVMVTIGIGWPKGRKRQDPSNVGHCLKPVIDGLTDAGYWMDDKQVTIREPIQQQTWGEWQDRGGWLHPHGVMTIEVEGVGR